MRRIVVMTLALTLFCGAVEGTEKFDPSPSAKLLAPFIEPETIAIVRIDFTRLDVEALFGKVEELHDTTKDHDVRGILQAKGAVNRWVAEFVRAGGKHFYFVYSLIDMPSPMYFTVVPVGPPADTKVISALLVSGDPEGAPTRPANYRGSRGSFGVTTTRRIGDVILAGRREIQLERLSQNPAVNRPEVAKAFAAAGDATVQVLLLPTADTRRVIEEMLPELPEEIGGGSSTVVTRGVMWVAIGVNGPPNMSARSIGRQRGGE
jgi:hypothetical protein